MSTETTPAELLLQRLADAMVEDILSMSDDEIRQELIEDGIDPAAVGSAGAYPVSHPGRGCSPTSHVVDAMTDFVSDCRTIPICPWTDKCWGGRIYTGSNMYHGCPRPGCEDRLLEQQRQAWRDYDAQQMISRLDRWLKAETIPRPPAEETLAYVVPGLIILRNMCKTAGLRQGREMADEMIQTVRAELRKTAPYPFCHHPEKCTNGRCKAEIVCND